jgi:hypothetical protein
MRQLAAVAVFTLAVFLSACGQGPQGPKGDQGPPVLRLREAIRGRLALPAPRGQEASKDLPARKVVRATKDHLARKVRKAKKATRVNKVQAAPDYTS